MRRDWRNRHWHLNVRFWDWSQPNGLGLRVFFSRQTREFWIINLDLLLPGLDIQVGYHNRMLEELTMPIRSITVTQPARGGDA